jgi:hypothetical protein
MIEGEDLENLKITGYTLPRRSETFSSGEVRNAFLAQSMVNTVYEDSDREKLAEYLDNTVWLSSSSKGNGDTSVYLSDTNERSVYKYKPVALKVKPVIQELPAEFRIKREILGDPLAEMPTLSPNPPDFEPTGRYTEERKAQFDKIHKEGFLLSEERKLMHHFMMLQSYGFAWDDTERGKF